MTAITITYAEKALIKGRKGPGVGISEIKYVSEVITLGSTSETYTTGGNAFDLRTFSKDGSTEPTKVYFHDFVNNTYLFKYDDANHKLLIYDLSAGTELANTTNVGAKTVLCEMEFE